MDDPVAGTRHASAGALRQFQDEFARAVVDPDGDAELSPALAALVRQPGFAVYRNTTIKGCIDALQANYPAVARIVGEDWFRAAAAVYARAELPHEPMLLRYGAGFEGFLATFPPAAELDYLPGVARLDRFWGEAHAAPDEDALTAGAVAPRRADGCGAMVVRPHAAARWAWFDRQPIFTIWSRNRAPGPYDDSEFDWKAEGALIVRPRDEVRWMPLGADGCALLDACAAGAPPLAALAAARAAVPGCDADALLGTLAKAGALVCDARQPPGGST